MNQVIFANNTVSSDAKPDIFSPFAICMIPISDIDSQSGNSILDYSNEDFVIEYMTPSKTIKTIEVNRETLNIQKINLFDVSNGGEYNYTIASLTAVSNANPIAVQIIRQDAVPHQRNSWYIELSEDNISTSFWNQLASIAKTHLLGIKSFNASNGTIVADNPLTFKLIGCTATVTSYMTKNPYQYLQMLLTKHVQNFGYNHTDDNAELNSGLADYKAWIAGTEADSTVAIYRLRFATNRKASKTRDERVWQNVYICTKGEDSDVATILDAYIAILNGEETEGGE